MGALPPSARESRAHRRGIHHRRDDLAVAGAAAEHAAERILDLAPRRAAELRSSSAVAATSRPGVQMPHCAAPWARNEACSADSLPLARPSTVRTMAPAADAAGTRQAQTGSPSSSTVQAPQSPASQPTLVPVRRNSSRSTEDSRAHRRDGNSDRRAVDARSRSRALRAHAAARRHRRRHGRPRRTTRASTISRAASRRYSARAAHVVDRRKLGEIGARQRLSPEPERGCRPTQRRPPAPAQAPAPPPSRSRPRPPRRRSRPSSPTVDPRRRHGDGNDEIAARAELEEGRRAAGRAFRHADRRHHFVGPQAPCGGCRG